MTLRLHLGVVDIPYAKAPKKHQRKSGGGGTQTTGDVAEWLENEYGVMEAFFEFNKADIAKSMEESLGGAFESMLMGHNSGNAFGTAESDIEQKFRDFISTQKVEQVGILGVPTQAALDGIDHRKKNPRTGVRRPSFRDTGLYEASFKAWFENE